MTEERVRFGFDFESGVEAGLERAEAYGLPSDLDQIQETLNKAREVIEKWPNPPGNRFQAIFAEDLTVASLARLQSEDHQPIGEVELRTALGFWVGGGMEKLLNEHGREGWELVFVEHQKGLLIFKRPVR